jgi:hypothetical protein
MVRTQYQPDKYLVKLLNPLKESIDIMGKSPIKVEGKFSVLLKKIPQKLRTDGDGNPDAKSDQREGVIQKHAPKSWRPQHSGGLLNFFRATKGGEL